MATITSAIPLVATYSEVLLGAPGSPQIGECEVEADIETTTILGGVYAQPDWDWQITAVRVRETLPDGSERWQQPGGTLARKIREWLERHEVQKIEDAAKAERLELGRAA